MARRESDPSIVLGGRESLLHGEGVDNSMQDTKETSAGIDRPDKLMSTSLCRISGICKRDKVRRFRGLYTLLNKTNLRTAFYKLNSRAAFGVDRISFQDYEDNLDENLDELVESLKQKRYRAKLIRRVYIPKTGGKLRPLGVPSINDKILQMAVSEILTTLFDADFQDFSYGYRSGRNAHDALDRLQKDLYECKGYVVEADIKSFFDNLDHKWLVRMLELRIDDRALIRLIRKWLKAGVLLPTGKVEYPQTGSPQGGIISPVLANIYLHYCLDLWFVKKFQTQCRGISSLVRYADDFVAGFQYREDATLYMECLKIRLEKFGLEVCEDKTRLIRFSRFGMGTKERNGRFDFLGFEFKWQLSRNGKAVITTETSKAKLKQTMRTMKEWVKAHRNCRLRNLFTRLQQKLLGYYNYYGVRGNFRRMKTVYQFLVRLLYKWLNRRSQRRSFNWAVFEVILAYYELPRPRIVCDGFGARC